MTKNMENDNDKTLCDLLSTLSSYFIKEYPKIYGSYDFEDKSTPRRTYLLATLRTVLRQNSELFFKVKEIFETDPIIVKNYGNHIGETLETLLVGDTGWDYFSYILDDDGFFHNNSLYNAIGGIILSSIDKTVLEYGEFKEQSIKDNIKDNLFLFKQYIQENNIEEYHLIGFSGIKADTINKVDLEDDISLFFLNDFQSFYFFGNKNTKLAIRHKYSRKKIFCGSLMELRDKRNEKHNKKANKLIARTQTVAQDVQLSFILTSIAKKSIQPINIENDYFSCIDGAIKVILQPSYHSDNTAPELSLTENQVKSLPEKYNSVCHNELLKKHSVAKTRLINSICNRDNDDDALIDAVICCENIIGTKSEVKFKICTSIAFLLSNNPNERRSIYEELDTIYKARNNLVHGNEKHKNQANKKNAKNAIFYAATLVNALLDNKIPAEGDISEKVIFRSTQ